jgi:hypothetical protein
VNLLLTSIERGTEVTNDAGHSQEGDKSDAETHDRHTQRWLVSRLELLKAEKELTRRSDELARQRQELAWVRIEKEYRFETDEGRASLTDLFRGRSTAVMVAGAGSTGGILAMCIGKFRRFFKANRLGLFQKTKEK